MEIYELITELQKYPPNTKVVKTDSQGFFELIGGVTEHYLLSEKIKNLELLHSPINIDDVEKQPKDTNCGFIVELF